LITKILHMKPKTFLLISTFVLGTLIARATDNKPDPGKKEDIMGSITNADNKKPLKDVSITAYLSSKKEKVMITDGSGTYAFDDMKPGVYKFVFEKEGYKKVIKEKVAVKVDEAFQLDIEMVKDGETDVMLSPSHFLYN
jgi:hypothetical protein